MQLPSGELIEWGNKDVRKLPEYRNTWQFGQDPFQWDPQHTGAAQGPSGGSYNVGYIPSLIDAAEALQRGEALPDYVREQVTNMLAAARATPMRDLGQLQAGYPGEGGDLSRYLTPASPDAGAVMLALRDKMQAGQATPQERGLYDTFLAQMREQDYRANVPQASDAFSVLGDNLFGALAILGTGATAGLAAAPLVAGGAGLASTLGSLGTLAGTAGGWAGTIGGATGQDWLQKAGLGLGALGGLAGGIGGLANLWGTGVQSLSDAARLASSVGKIGGALGSASGSPALKQAAGYLGMAGQAGQLGSGVLPTSFTDWSGTNAPLAANVAPGVSNLLSAADQATQRGGPMDFDYSWDYGGDAPYDNWSWDAGATTPDYLQSDAYKAFTGWGGDETQQGWYQSADLDISGGGGGGGGGWLNTILGGLGSVGKFLGSNSSWLGPAASALGGLGAGGLGANASNEAARLQAAALNRGIDLSTAQWLAQQANLAPYLQAGQQGLSQLQQLAGRQGPAMPGATGAISGANYALPSTTPGWQPQTFQGPAALNAGDYRYTSPGTVNPAQYAWNAPQALDPNQYAFNTPGGQELLAKDPGYQFRQEEARKALEASALARGTGMSGATLSALQRQSQDLASNEYQNAYGRALGENQLRYGRGLTADQENYQRQLQANQLGYGRATEQQQLAANQGLQAAGFNWQSALQGQQTGYNQALQTSQYNQQQQSAYTNQLYQQMMEQAKLRYGQDVAANETDYARQQALYRQQLAQHLLPWEQQTTLANLGGQATGMFGQQGQAAASGISNLLGQLGSAQGIGQLGSAYNWNQAIGGGTSALQNLLKGLNA